MPNTPLKKTGQTKQDAQKAAAGQKGSAAPLTLARPAGNWAWLAALLGGLAGALSYEPFNLAFLIPLAPLGIFLAMRWSARPRTAFLRAWAGAWVYYFGALHWLLTVRQYNPFPPLVMLGIVVLGLYLALYPALAAFAVRKWLGTERPFVQFFAFGALWLFGEWFRTLGRLSMPLPELGHAWAIWPQVAQIAAWLGELGVSLQVLLVGAVLYGWARLLHKKKQAAQAQGAEKGSCACAGRCRCVPVLLTALTLILFVGSFFSYRSWNRKQADALASPRGPVLNVALVQPNIFQWFKLQSYADENPETRQKMAREITDLQDNMLKEFARPEWDLVILPETAFTEENFGRNAALLGRLGAIARRTGADLFFGADHKKEDSTPVQSFNSAYLMRQDGTLGEMVYDKMRLVPFGENLPYFDMIPGFQEGVVGIMSFNAGQKQELFETGGMKFGALICFESTFSSMSRALSKMGADFLVVITNDAWYEWPNLQAENMRGPNIGAAHHHHVSILRAIETRRPLLRCANTGISSIISPSGKITENLGINQRGVLVGTITPLLARDAQTLYARIGNAWLLAPALWLLALFIRGFRARRGAPIASSEGACQGQ